MAEYQTKLNFSLKELVPFRDDQLVREIKSASLEPNVICHEHGQYVILRGKLVFCGEYYPQSYEVQEDFFAEQNVADVFRNNENGCCTFNYAFPVDITIPQDRILSTDEISIGIDNFDCIVQENGFVNVNAQLFVDGVYDREYVEHVRYQNQTGAPQFDEIPALNVNDEIGESAGIENHFAAAEEHIHSQEYTGENSSNQYADLRNNQSDAWDVPNYEQQVYSQKEANDQQHINPSVNQNEHSEIAQNNKESYDEQIKYHTTYDYDPWNQNFNNNNNTYSQADYYRNPFEATYQGGAGTQYYNQPHEKIENNEPNIEDTEAEFINQYIKYSPIQKPEFAGLENSDYDLKFVPEEKIDADNKEARLTFEQPIYNEVKEEHYEAANRTEFLQNQPEITSESHDNVNIEEAHKDLSSAIDQHEVELDIENPAGKYSSRPTNGYDKVVFPFTDDENTFEHTDDYEFSDETPAQPISNPVQENPKVQRPEIGKSRVVSDIFNVRGKVDKSSCLKVYIVQRGDSLEQLAEKYSTNASKIAHYNQLQLDDKILEGQVIYIPE